VIGPRAVRERLTSLLLSGVLRWLYQGHAIADTFERCIPERSRCGGRRTSRDVAIRSHFTTPSGISMDITSLVAGYLSFTAASRGIRDSCASYT